MVVCLSVWLWLWLWLCGCVCCCLCMERIALTRWVWTCQYAETPLFFAARRSHAKVVRLLLQRGANTATTSRFGDTAQDETTDAGTLAAFETGMRAHSFTAVAMTRCVSLVVGLCFALPSRHGTNACVSVELPPVCSHSRVLELARPGEVGVHLWAMASDTGAGGDVRCSPSPGCMSPMLPHSWACRVAVCVVCVAVVCGCGCTRRLFRALGVNRWEMSLASATGFTVQPLARYRPPRCVWCCALGVVAVGSVR